MYKLYHVNKRTWKDDYAVSVESARVINSSEGTLQTGSFTTKDSLEAGYHRLVHVVDGRREDICTMMFRSFEGQEARGYTSQTITGFSVLEPATKKRLFAGEYAPAGSDGAQYAASLLEDCIDAPVEVLGSFRLDNSIVFDKCTVLEAVKKVLEAGNFIMQITGGGVVRILPKPASNSLVLRVENIDYEQTRDIPNRYIAINGDSVVTAVNDNQDSPTSVQAVGYYIDEIDESPKLVDGETLYEYARRKLAEKSVIKTRKTYDRVFSGGVLIGDLVQREALMRVVGQEITCGAAVTVRESAEKEVQTWIA